MPFALPTRRLLLQGIASSSVVFAGGLARAATGPDVLKRPFGRGLYELAYAPGSNTLYVASINDFRDGKGGRILLLDPTSLEQRGAIEMPLKPFALTIDPDRGVLYVGHTMDGAMSVLDLASGTVRATVRLDTPDKHHPREIRLDPAGKRIFVTGIGDPSVVWVVDADTLSVRAVIGDTGKWAAGLAYDPVAKRILIGDYNGGLSVADPAEGRVLSRQVVGDADKTFLVNITPDPKRRLLYAANSKASDIVVLDADTLAVVRSIPCGKAPLAVLVDAARDRLVVTNRGAGTATVFGLADDAVQRTAELGDLPNSIALDPATGALFFSTKQILNRNDPKYNPETPDNIVRLGA